MKIGLLGFGVVGGGIGDIITDQKKRLEALIGEEVILAKALVKDVKDHTGTRFEAIVTENVDDILNDPTIDVVFEALGGIDVPFAYLTRALEGKKHVITANKAVIAAHYPALQALANANQVTLSVEASVGGGIPIISTLEDHLLFGETPGIHGILNGTGNFILSKVEADGWSFAEALAKAQALGYAEAIPDDDVDGFDASRKILILTALIHGQYFTLSDLFISSIRNVSPIDFATLAELGATIRYVVSCEQTESGLYLAARPVVVQKNSAFGQTFLADNCVVFKHGHLNELSLKGPGAGKLPTANAMVADLVRLKGRATARQPEFIPGTLGPVPKKYYYVRCTDQAIDGVVDAEFEIIVHTNYALIATDKPAQLAEILKAIDPDAFLAEYALV